MKILTKQGVKEFCKKYNAKLAQGNNLTPYIEIYINDADDLNKAIWNCKSILCNAF